jgi:hypothetical protein
MSAFTNPATDAQLVTPSDSADLAGGLCRALYIAVGGTLKVTVVKGSDRADRTITVGAGVLPLQVIRVWSTGTSASSIAALY